MATDKNAENNKEPGTHGSTAKDTKDSFELEDSYFKRGTTTGNLQKTERPANTETTAVPARDKE